MAQQFDVMQSLFGFGPADVQRQIGAEQEQRAMGLASGVPGGLGAGAFQAFRAQERARGTPLFASQEDTRLTEARTMQEARQAAQPAFEQGGLVGYLNQYAIELEKRGLVDKAVQARSVAAQKEQEGLKTQAETGLKQAQALAALREKEPKALEEADRIRLAQLQQKFGEVEGAKKFREERDQVSKQNAEAAAARLSLEGQKKILNIDEKDAAEYQQQRNSARKALTSLSRMQELIKQGVIAGTAQEARLGFLRTLGTLGVNTGKAQKVVSNTEQFDKEVRTLLLAIIKQLGYNPSNADVRFALDSLPSLTNSAEGLQEIINRFYKVNKDTLDEAERGLTYYRQNNGSFQGFTPNINVWSPKTITPQDLSDEELQTRLREARNRKQANQ